MRQVSAAADYTRMAFSLTTGGLAGPAGVGGMAVDAASATGDLITRRTDAASGTAVVIVTVGALLVHARLGAAGEVFAESGAGGLEPRIRMGVGGRVESAFARIGPEHLGQGTRTTAQARTLARQLGTTTDDAGHVIGRSLGGAGGATSSNIIPQAIRVNRGEFAQFEAMIAERVAAGDEVFVRIVPRYTGDATRAYEIMYQVRINGKTVSRVFSNP
jgi:hypothetical protein